MLFCNSHKVEWVFVDGTGVGGGVVDHLRRRGLNVIDVQFGAKADQRGLDQMKFANKRAEIWGLMRNALQYVALPNSTELRKQLTAPEYGYNIRGEILLESKDLMKRRGVASPDVADALATTFASEMAIVPVSAEETRGMVVTDWDPFSTDAMNRTARAAIHHARLAGAAGGRLNAYLGERRRLPAAHPPTA